MTFIRFIIEPEPGGLGRGEFEEVREALVDEMDIPADVVRGANREQQERPLSPNTARFFHGREPYQEVRDALIEEYFRDMNDELIPLPLPTSDCVR